VRTSAISALAELFTVLGSCASAKFIESTVALLDAVVDQFFIAIF
jgi:hypothetical protein